MFRELVELGSTLEQERKLPPAGFYDYREPLSWVVHFGPDGIHLEKPDQLRPRPFSGRTSSPEAHLLADEAAYSLGVSVKSDGSEDAHAKRKHQEHFRVLYRSFLTSGELNDPHLRDAINVLDLALEQNRISKDPRFGEIRSKDWVSFMPEFGRLKATHLFEHPDAKTYWVQEMQRRCGAYVGGSEIPIRGACSVCGRDDQLLIRKLPLKVRLAATTPIHSLNRDAFTSFIAGASTSDKAQLGLCYTCGETASRGFNFLSDSKQHRRTIYRHPKRDQRDKLVNQHALFWLKAPAAIRTGDQTLDLSDFSQFDPGSVAALPDEAPQATLSQMLAILKQPWAPNDTAFRLDDYGFYLGILSPNVGRIAIRDWLSISITQLKRSLAAFLEGTRMISPWGEDAHPVPVNTLVEAIGGGGGAELTRALLRSAYTDVPPPSSLALKAGLRLNHLNAHEDSLRERQRRLGRDQVPVWNDAWPQALAAAVKLGLFYRKEESQTMGATNSSRTTQAYLCGRLFALLEEAQQLYSLHQSGERLSVSIVVRAYGGASSTPAPVFGRLFRVASSAHLPDVRRWFRDDGTWVNDEVDRISAALKQVGGFPETLSLTEQAEFGLGFYHQRALIRGRGTSRGASAAKDAGTAQNS